MKFSPDLISHLVYSYKSVYYLPSVLHSFKHLHRGPLLWIWPLYLHVNQKSDDDDDDDDDISSQKSQAFNIICWEIV